MPHQHHAGHQHHYMEKRQEQATVVQYVYETAAKTFDGPIAGYSTVNAPPAENTPQSKPDTSKSNSNSDSQQQQEQQQQQQQQQAAEQQEAAESSSAVAAQLAEASSSAVAAAQASMETAAQPTPTSIAQTQSQTQEEVETTPTTSLSKGNVSVKESSTTSPTKKVAAPSVTAAVAPSSEAIASTPTSSFIESTSSSVPSETAAASSGSSSGSAGGMSGGAKAGLAIGVLLAIGLLAAGIFLCYRRRKKQNNEAYGKTDDEKSAYAGGLARAQSTTSTRTTATAPRLSLRPVTQFLPDLAARGKAANAAGAAAGGAAGGAAMASKDHKNPVNPFGNHAAVPPPSQASSENEKAALPIQANAPENPFTDSARTAPPTDAAALPPTSDMPAPLRVKTPTPESAAATGAGAAALCTGSVVAAKAADRHNAPKPLNLSPSRPASPAMSSPVGSESSQTTVSTAAFANGPPSSNVHRIQLDFKPSMDDELSLRAGQLVRLLHEYDDGWALCIRLDRSQQGVAPRTCLSARPVKPRPPPGARGPGPRGPPPGMMGPGQQRPASPASGRGSPSPYARAPRPMSPGANRSQQRSMSPGPYGGGPQRPANMLPQGGKRRSNSASDLRDRRQSPLGPSPMNPNVQRVPMQLQAVTSPDQALSQSPSQTMARKPVPGQAM